MRIAIALTILLLALFLILITSFDFIGITKKFLEGNFLYPSLDDEKYEIVCSDNEPRTKIITKDGFIWHSGELCDFYLPDEAEFSEVYDYGF